MAKKQSECDKSKEMKKGFIGWREFNSNRDILLSEYDLTRKLNASRPVSVEHGISGEAIIRKWLENFLPSRYGVTSGYIISHLMQMKEYKLFHYDIIVYDKLNSPILWEYSHADNSDQGKKRAIPKRYVRAVFEVKAKYNSKNIKEAIKNLEEINTFNFQLNFSCGIIYFELDPRLMSRKIQKQMDSVLNLLPKNPIEGYWGGIILRADINPEMSGLIEIFPYNDGKQRNCEVPLVANIDDFELNEIPSPFPEASGYEIHTKPGYRVKSLPGPGLYKEYGPMIYKDQYRVSINWGYNKFALFCSDLLDRLGGASITHGVNSIVPQVKDI